MTIDESAIRALPKVVLHDHLDGGLRPATIVELAAEVGHELPATDPAELGAWFVRGRELGQPRRCYLETFDHTIAVMQTADGLRRVAREAALDLAADGVVYAEQRYAPEQHLQRRADACRRSSTPCRPGFDEGVAEAAAQGRTIRIGTAASPRCGTPTAATRSPRSRSPTGTAASSASTSPAPRTGSRRRGTRRRSGRSRERELPRDRPRRRGRRARLDRARRVHVGRRAAPRARRADRRRHRRCTARRRHGGPRRGRRSAASRTGCATTRSRSSCARRRTCRRASPASVAEHPITLLKELGFAVTVNTDNRLHVRHVA